MIQELLKWAAMLFFVSWAFAGFTIGLKLIQEYRRDRKEGV